MPQLGLMWMKHDEQAGQQEFALAVGFHALYNPRLYPGKNIEITATDATGAVIPASSYYEFNKGRATIFIEFSRMPQGGWVALEGQASMSKQYREESYSIKPAGAQQSVEGEGFALSCSVDGSKPHEFLYREKGFGHVTYMQFYDAQGREIEPLANRTLENNGVVREMVFIFAPTVEASSLSFAVKRREAQAAVDVPIKLRINLAGGDVSAEAMGVRVPATQLAPLSAGLGSLRWVFYSQARRAGVARGRYEAVNLGLLYSPPEGKKVIIRPQQKIQFHDGRGGILPAHLSFVTARENGDVLLSFRVDGVAASTPFGLYGALQAELGGESVLLPIKLDIGAFPEEGR